MTFKTALLAAALVAATPALAQDSYRIGTGDVLRIEVLEDGDLNRTVLVSPDGRITVPLAGSIPAAGRSLDQVQADLAGRLAPNFAAAPNVYVSLDRLAERRAATGPVTPATIEVYILGEAAKPGVVELEPGTTLLQALAAMGGFSKFAATKRLQLRRIGPDGSEQVYLINYRAIEQGQSAAGNTVLAEGDVIIIPQRGLFE